MITKAAIQEAYETMKDRPVDTEEWAELEGIEVKDLVFWCAEYLDENFKNMHKEDINDLSILCTAMILGIRFGVYAARKEASEFTFPEGE